MIKKFEYTFKLLLTVAAVLLFIGYAGATNYYVGNDGNDGANGQSPTSAWRTLGRSVTDLSAGDTLFLMGGLWDESNPSYGDHPPGTLIPVTSGGYGNPIVFTAYPDSARPIIEGNNRTNHSIAMENRSHLVFQRIEAR